MLGLSQLQVADRLSVKPTALSNWENGTRTISLDIEQIDKALEGGGVLAGMLWAYGTNVGLEPDTLWTKVFAGEPTPVWLWIRSPTSRLQLAGEWGVARVDREIELGPNGLFMTVGMAVPESPVVIHLSEPGWADFGRGEPPDDIPGAPVMAAINHAERSSASGTFMDLFFGNLADRFSRSRSRDLAKLNRSAPRSLASFFQAFGAKPSEQGIGAWPPLEAEETVEDRQRFARLRQARHLSLVDAAQRLAEVTGIEVSKDTLRRFETSIGEPHDRFLPAALDQMLGADGHLAAAEVRADNGSGSVRLPPYWEGPVWFEFSGETDGAPIQILWGDWYREIEGSLPMRLVYHYAERAVPMRIVAGSGVSWRVGLGRRPGDAPINRDWVPISVDVAQRAISETEDALLISLERGQTERKRVEAEESLRAAKREVERDAESAAESAEDASADGASDPTTDEGSDGGGGDND